MARRADLLLREAKAKGDLVWRMEQLRAVSEGGSSQVLGSGRGTRMS